VEEVEAPELVGGDTVVRMACLDDDANGQKLEVGVPPISWTGLRASHERL